MSTSLRITFIALIVLMAVGLVQLKAQNRALEQATASQGVAK
jgi:hypothetical protein